MSRARPLAFVRRVPLAERLDAYSIPEPNSGCLLWMGNVRAGYGRADLSG